MSNDVKLTVGVGVIVVAIFGSAWLVSHVMIELAGVVRADLQALRESMEAIACGELARNDDAVAGIESSNPTPTVAHGGPSDGDRASPGRCLAEWPSLRWDYCRVYPLAGQSDAGDIARRIIRADGLPCAFLGPAPLR